MVLRQRISTDDSQAEAATTAVRSGDTAELERLLAEHPSLAMVGVVDGCGVARTLLHVATDWPANFPNAAETIAALVRAGADVDARIEGANAETPLHWAASSDDVVAIDALVAAGADIDATGAVIGGGTPLADATAFGQWNAAQRLLEHGAQPNLWQAAALGRLDRVEQLCAEAPPEPDAVTEAFWGACHGGQHGTAAFLLERGADRNWIGWDDLTPLDAARRSDAPGLVAWLASVGAVSGKAAQNAALTTPRRRASRMRAAR